MVFRSQAQVLGLSPINGKRLMKISGETEVLDICLALVHVCMCVYTCVRVHVCVHVCVCLVGDVESLPQLLYTVF